MLTKLSKGLIAATAAVALVAGGFLGGYELQKQTVKPVVKYVEVMVKPTVLPTASPSATLGPVRSRIYTPIVVTAPVKVIK